MRFATTSIQRIVLAIIIASLLVLGVRPLIFHASAATLQNRRLLASSSIVDDTASYDFSFKLKTAGTLGSIRFMFCEGSPLPTEPCPSPVGFDASAATFDNQFGVTGFGMSTTTNEILLTRSPLAVGATSVAYRFGNITNPSATGSYFVRIFTYASGNGTGAYTDYGGLAYDMTELVNISTTVPPYLLFCMGVVITGYDCSTASGDYVNFGELSKTQAKSATTQLLVATNAGSGYSVTVNGTTMLSGVNSIPAITATDVSRPGTSQFGINLRKNTDPSVGSNPAGPGTGTVTGSYNIPNRYHFVSGEQIASSPNAEAYRKYTVSYLVNVANGQQPGVYVSTLTYITNASF